MRRTFILRNSQIAHHCGAQIAALQPTEQSLYRVIIEAYEDDQKREQQEKYHAMIGDIARQIEWMGKKRDTETWKRLLIEAFVHVMREQATAQGKPDPFRGRGEVVPSLDGQRVVQLGVQSRKFGIRIASQFIEYLYAWGAEKGVVWTDRRIAA